MNLIRQIGTFGVILSAAMGLAYYVHAALVVDSEADIASFLPGFYLMNAVIGLCVGALVLYLSQARPDITGFTFMGGSLLKFAVFFVAFFPALSEEESARKSQFVAFFIPYALAMIIEVCYLIRRLNKQQ
ncbi:MAG: DUF6168 family protein [Cryomorphaceae bacterium]